MSDLNNYIRLVENADQLDELNWKKGLATAAAAGAMALGGGGANAQSSNYLNSPLHRDLSNISNKLDQKIQQQQKINKLGATSLALSITGGLAALGNAWQNSKFKDAAEEIMSKGEWKIYKNQTPLEVGGTMTMIAGSGKVAILTDTSHLAMAGGVSVGVYDETSPGIVEKGRLKIDLENGTWYSKSVFGGETKIKFKLVDSSDQGTETSAKQNSDNEKTEPKKEWTSGEREQLKSVGDFIRSRLSVKSNYDKLQHSVILINFDEEGFINGVKMKQTTGDEEADKQLMKQVVELDKLPDLIVKLRQDHPEFKVLGLKTDGIKRIRDATPSPTPPNVAPTPTSSEKPLPDIDYSKKYHGQTSESFQFIKYIL